MEGGGAIGRLYLVMMQSGCYRWGKRETLVREGSANHPKLEIICRECCLMQRNGGVRRLTDKMTE